MARTQSESRSDASRAAPRKPTLPQPKPVQRLLRATSLRRVGILFLALFVIVGLTGVLGSRTSRVTSQSRGYVLTVTYPRATRPGLPVRWEYEVQHPGGFEGKILVGTTFEYLHLFDVTGIQPDASSQTATAEEVIWEFDPPQGDVFRVSFDAATEAGFHESPTATVRVVTGGHQVVAARFRTVVIP